MSVHIATRRSLFGLGWRFFAARQCCGGRTRRPSQRRSYQAEVCANSSPSKSRRRSAKDSDTWTRAQSAANPRLFRMAFMTSLGAVAVAPRMGSPLGSRAASFTNSAYSGRKSSVPHSHMQCASSITRHITFFVNGIWFKTCLWNCVLSAISGPTSPTRNWF